MSEALAAKEVVMQFYALALGQFKPSQAFEKFATPDFIEHSADIPAGTGDAAVEFLENLIRRFPAPKWKIVRSAAEVIWFFFTST